MRLPCCCSYAVKGAGSRGSCGAGGGTLGSDNTIFSQELSFLGSGVRRDMHTAYPYLLVSFYYYITIYPARLRGWGAGPGLGPAWLAGRRPRGGILEAAVPTVRGQWPRIVILPGRLNSIDISLCSITPGTCY